MIVEIGSLREPVELLETPRGAPRARVGRIRHANGENAEIDLATLELLMARARAAREGWGPDVSPAGLGGGATLAA